MKTATNSNSSPYSNLYKYSSKTAQNSHQERINEFLNKLKERRNRETDKNRNFSELFFGEGFQDDDNEITDFQEECMELEHEQGPSSPRRRKKLKFDLQHSEVLKEVPSDLTENWLVKCCPDGFRVLLVARHHLTEVYTKSGKFLFPLKTNLPGGGGKDAENVSGLTVLDCVYNKTAKVFFIIDCLCWNSMSMLDSEASLRFFWLASKFQENSELRQTGHAKNIILMALDYFTADVVLIQDKMASLLPINDICSVAYDGIAIYHKEGAYAFGTTPLVCWAASFTLPELFNIDVNPKHLLKKPEDYTTLGNYLENLIKKPKRKSFSKNQMETEGIS